MAWRGDLFYLSILKFTGRMECVRYCVHSVSSPFAISCKMDADIYSEPTRERKCLPWRSLLCLADDFFITTFIRHNEYRNINLFKVVIGQDINPQMLGSFLRVLPLVFLSSSKLRFNSDPTSGFCRHPILFSLMIFSMHP